MVADPGIGPHWVAGGTSLTWGQIESNQELGGTVSGIGKQVAASVTGGTLRTLVTGSFSQAPTADGGAAQVEAHLTYGVGQGCSTTPGVAPFGMTAAGGALGLIALAARRRRRNG